MLSVFKSNNPPVVLLYLPYLVALRLFFVWSGDVFMNTDIPPEPLSRAIFLLLPDSKDHLLVILPVAGAIVQFIHALMMNVIVNQNKMTSRKTHLPGVVYLLLSAMFAENMLLSAAQLGLTFVLGSLINIFQLTKKEKMNGTLFDAGMLMGLAISCYWPYVVLIIFLFLSLSTLRAIVLREWIVVLLGVLTPFFLLFTVYYVGDLRAPCLYSEGIFIFKKFSIAHQAGLALLSVLTLFALGGLQGALYSAIIQVRKITTVLLLFFVFVIAGFFIQERVAISHLMGLFVPVTVIGCMILVQLKRWKIAEVLHIILLLLVLALQWLPVFNII